MVQRKSPFQQTSSLLLLLAQGEEKRKWVNFFRAACHCRNVSLKKKKKKKATYKFTYLEKTVHILHFYLCDSPKLDALNLIPCIL